MDDLEYGPVLITAGPLKGRILYYDDDEGRSTACYAGHPYDFAGCYRVQRRFLREPNIDDLLKRLDAIGTELRKMWRDHKWMVDPEDVHELWAERAFINDILFEQRLHGRLKQIGSGKTVFLCHSSSDKGPVRMVNDDLRRLGATTWLDENNIKVGALG